MNAPNKRQTALPHQFHVVVATSVGGDLACPQFRPYSKGLADEYLSCLQGSHSKGLNVLCQGKREQKTQPVGILKPKKLNPVSKQAYI